MNPAYSSGWWRRLHRVIARRLRADDLTLEHWWTTLRCLTDRDFPTGSREARAGSPGGSASDGSRGAVRLGRQRLSRVEAGSLAYGTGRSPLRSATGGPVVTDASTPAFIVKLRRYPLHHGGVGAIRSLGRLGVPVFAVTEDRFTPAAVSRYLRARFTWPTTGLEDPDTLVDGLLRMSREI